MHKQVKIKGNGKQCIRVMTPFSSSETSFSPHLRLQNLASTLAQAVKVLSSVNFKHISFGITQYL